MSIKSELEKHLTSRVYTNDANCAALAEKKVGAGRNAKTLLLNASTELVAVLL